MKDKTMNRWYRGGTPSSMPQGTAQDVLDYERDELGNTLNLYHLRPPSTIPASECMWLCRKQKDARRYGHTERYELRTWEIIATDNEGGYLVWTVK